MLPFRQSPTESLVPWEQSLAMGKTITGNLEDLSAPERRFLESFTAQSFAVFPIFIGDALWGFAMFCSAAERSWSADEIEALRITTNILSAAMR